MAKKRQLTPEDHKQIDAYIVSVMGKKVALPTVKFADIQVGKRFWDFVPEEMRWRLIKITYMRGDVVFFKEGNRKEDYFDRHTLMLRRLEPEHFVSTLDPEFYEQVSRSKKVKITYSKPISTRPSTSSRLRRTA